MTEIDERTIEPLKFELTYQTEHDYPTRMARAYYRYTWSQPRRYLPFVIYLVLIVILSLMSTATHASFTPLLPAFVVLVLFAVLYVISYLASVRQLRRRIPIGSVFGIGFRSRTMVIRSPQVTSEVAYDLYKSCERRGGFVILRQRVSRLTTLLPVEIFTDESLTFLSAKITPPT